MITSYFWFRLRISVGNKTDYLVNLTLKQRHVSGLKISYQTARIYRKEELQTLTKKKLQKKISHINY